MEEQQRFGAYEDDRTFWEKVWHNEEGDVVIWQWPNIWLIGWAAVNFVSLIMPAGGIASNILWWIGVVLLTIWSILEVAKGVNYFRRALGVAGLLINIFLVIHGGF